MQIEGKDNDEAGTINSAIAYTIISQEPEVTGHMFTIEKNTGKLFVKEPTLDREVRLLLTAEHVWKMMMQPFSCAFRASSF